MDRWRFLPAEVSVRFGAHVRGKRTVDQLAFRVENAFFLKIPDGGVTVRLEPFAHLLVEKGPFFRITAIDISESEYFGVGGHYTFSIGSRRSGRVGVWRLRLASAS